MIQDELQDRIMDGLDRLLVHAEYLTRDMEKFATELASDAAQAVARGDAEWLEELEAQVLLLAEKHRIRVHQEEQRLFIETLEMLVGFAVKVGVALATEALKSLANRGKGSFNHEH
jgi:DNA transposition AAA+ family ATPase